MTDLTRRTAFQLATAAGAGAAATSVTKRKEVTTFVFVTGSNGVASGDAELTLRGHRTVGVSLPGHGPEDQLHMAYQAPQDLAELAALPSPWPG
ncbi:hypothetical protein ACFQ0B_21715 [Nonomuraea thailandensis]